MEQNTLPVEVILSHPRQYLGSIRLDWTPQPGNYLDLEGQTYAVLERHHRYQLKSGRYRLQKIALYVQSATPPTERTLVSGIWVIGDASCRSQWPVQLLLPLRKVLNHRVSTQFHLAQPRVPRISASPSITRNYQNQLATLESNLTSSGRR